MAKINFQKIMKTVVDKAPGLVVGSLAANLVATQVSRLSKGAATPMVVAGAQIVAGALLPSLTGSTKAGGFMAAVGEGIMAQGAVQLAKALKIPGIGNVGEDMSYEQTLMGTSSYEETPTLTGASA